MTDEPKKRTRKAKAEAPVVIEKEASPNHYISFDLGNGYCNIQADDGIKVDFRSLQSVVSKNNSIADLPFDDVIFYNNEWRVFGDHARTYGEKAKDFTTTERYVSMWYKQLFAYSLHRAYGLRTLDIFLEPTIVCSVPATEFMSAERVQKISNNLCGQYSIQTTHGNLLNVNVLPEKLTIIPEGAGTYFYMLGKSDIAGRSAFAEGLWLIVDVGYLTTDIVGFRNGEYVPEISVSDAKLGMQSVAKKVSSFIQNEGGKKIDLSEYDVMTCGVITVRGSHFDVSATREKALDEMGDEIGRLLMTTAGEENITGVVLTGGVAPYVDGRIKATSLPVIMKANDPRRSNVEGAHDFISGK